MPTARVYVGSFEEWFVTAIDVPLDAPETFDPSTGNARRNFTPAAAAHFTGSPLADLARSSIQCSRRSTRGIAPPRRPVACPLGHPSCWAVAMGPARQPGRG